MRFRICRFHFFIRNIGLELRFLMQEFNDLVKRELMGERSQVTFLAADGIKFAHPLHHLGKSKEDLPLIAIDSFRHMYLFPNYQDSKQPVSNKYPAILILFKNSQLIPFLRYFCTYPHFLL